MKKILAILTTAALFCAMQTNVSAKKQPVKKVYMTFVLHGNMNYDRYVRPTIWKEFPVIYDGLLSFMDEHPDFKGQLQFSGQTFGSMQQAAPEVIQHAIEIHKRGQLNFTGTFYSEPVNVNMDGETNYRCAWFGTRIIEDNVGQTDGFYLQERAYHPQLPWIFNHSNVSWTPIITNDDSYFPFKLSGLDGSTSVCVPITRGDFIPVVEKAPKNALISIEEDYEIPQTFTRAYKRSQEFNETHKDVQIEWITVAEYIKRFGVKPEKYVDHTAKVGSPENGTYSRWTADPLDIVVQDYTNKAMNSFRLGNAADALASSLLGEGVDVPFENSGITLEHDPLVWNIERAELYPDHDKYLMRNGKTTILSKSEQLLLWAVNSDAKGWYPLYEKRRERINSLENSANLSQAVLDKALDRLGSIVKAKDYESYYIVLNMEAERECEFSFESLTPCGVYDLETRTELKSHSVFNGRGCTVSAKAKLPAYGYAVIGTRSCAPQAERWVEASEISNAGMSIKVDGDKVILHTAVKDFTLYVDSFKLKALAHMDAGKADDQWRDNKPYGGVRTSICTDGLYPRLRMEWQPDWLVHVQQVFTLMEDRVTCDMTLDFPHPTVVRREGTEKTRTNFRPEGIDLVVESGEPGTFGYDIPFGISEMSRPGVSYFCPLTSCFVNFNRGGGFMLSPQTGEQAFSIDAADGKLTLFLGASTTSGPIREMGLKMPDKTTAEHDYEWYAEPFHGKYKHSYTIMPFEQTWKAAHLPKQMRSISQKPYVHQIQPKGGDFYAPARMSIIEDVPDNVDITSIYTENGVLKLRLNEKEGIRTNVKISVMGKMHSGVIEPYGIQSF